MLEALTGCNCLCNPPSAPHRAQRGGSSDPCLKTWLLNVAGH